MQWVFLVLALSAALLELHTGTFYLAGVAAAALLATLIGFWVRGDLLIFVFVLLCASVVVAVFLYRRRRVHSTLVDFDIGGTVTVIGVSPHGNSLVVNYRGAPWEAVTEDGSGLAPGDTAVIMRRTDKLLYLAVPPAVVRT